MVVVTSQTRSTGLKVTDLDRLRREALVEGGGRSCTNPPSILGSRPDEFAMVFLRLPDKRPRVENTPLKDIGEV